MESKKTTILAQKNVFSPFVQKWTHAGRFKNTSWQDSISGMLLRREVGGGREKQLLLEGKRLAAVPDSGVSLFPHYFARIPRRIWRKNGNEKPPPLCTMKKRARDPMRLVIRRQSRINGRFADKPRKTFLPSPPFSSISCKGV